MTDDYTVRALREEDRDLVLALMRESLGEGPMGRSPKVWQWKHRSSPFGASPGLVAEAGGEMVGLRLFLPWQWTAAGRTVRALRAVDTATRSDWRGRGIFRRLTLDLVRQMEEEGASFIFNTPNSKSRPGYLKMGWNSVARLRLRVRPTASLFRRPFRQQGHPEELPPAPGQPIEDLLAERHLPEILGRFTSAEAQRWSTPRTTEYLRWRYGDAPRLGYRALWRFDSTSGAAIIVRTRYRGPLREASLAEILITPDRNGDRAAIELVREIAACGVDILVATAAKGTPEQRATHDFLPFIVPSRHFTLRPLGETPSPDPNRWSAWRFSLGDLEVF